MLAAHQSLALATDPTEAVKKGGLMDYSDCREDGEFSSIMLYIIYVKSC